MRSPLRSGLWATLTTVLVLVACADSDSAGSGASGSAGAAGAAQGAPCTLEAKGHPTAQPVALQILSTKQLGGFQGCNASMTLLHTEQEYGAWLGPDAGAAGGGGGDAGSGVDWTTHAVLVRVALSNPTLAAMGLDGTTLVVLEQMLCQGMAPQCQSTLYVVPSAASVATESCPFSGPCNAP